MCLQIWANVHKAVWLHVTMGLCELKTHSPFDNTDRQKVWQCSSSHMSVSIHQAFSHHKLCKLLYFWDKSPNAVPDCAQKRTPRFANVSHNCMFRFWSSETEWFGLLSLSFCYKLTSCGALWEAVLLLTTRAVDGKKSGDDYWGLPDILQRATLETALLTIDWKTIYTHGNKLQYVKISLK